MFQRILVPLDGSSVAERAIPIATRLARAVRGFVVFFYRIAPVTPLRENPAVGQEGLPRTSTRDQIIAEATDYLARVQARYAKELDGVRAETEIACGSVAETLASTAYRNHIDLIITCFPRGEKSSQWSLECIAQQGAHPKQTPLLIMSDQENRISGLDGAHLLRILLPLDGSLFSETALKPALQLLSQ